MHLENNHCGIYQRHHDHYRQHDELHDCRAIVTSYVRPSKSRHQKLAPPSPSKDSLSACPVTVNVVGPADGSDPAARLAEALAVPGVHVHLYGKAPRPGRKLGHVTVCGEDLDAAQEAARLAVARLEGARR